MTQTDYSRAEGDEGVQQYVDLYGTFSPELLRALKERSLTVATNILYASGIPTTPTEVATLIQMAFTSAVLFAVKEEFATMTEKAIKLPEPELKVTTPFGQGQYL